MGPIYMLYAELGRMPVEVTVKSRMIGYWLSLVNGKETKRSTLLYKKLLHEYNAGYEHKWVSYIKDILVSVGQIDLLNKEVIDNPRSVKLSMSRVLFDLHIQEWVQKVNSSSKGRIFYSFKQDLNFEKYLIKLDRKQYLPPIKFRTSNHRLPIETGRWENVPFDDRKCQLCHKDELGDEFHYLFCCNYFETERKRHLKPYFYKRPNIIKQKELLASDNLATLKKLSEFVQIIMNKCATTFST